METKTKTKKEGTFEKVLKKATRSLTKFIKNTEEGRYKLNALSIHNEKHLVTNGAFLVYGDGLKKILPEHEVNTIRVPNIDNAIKAANHIGKFDVFHISTPRLKDGPIAFDVNGKAVGFRPDEEVDLYIGEYDSNKHILINSKYLNLAYDLGITSFKWDKTAKAILGFNGLCGVDIVISAMNITK